MYKISIPKPCHSSWHSMTPNEEGRYCNACAKTVVDFSVMSDAAIQHYFMEHYGQKICGRFKSTQIERIVIDLPPGIFRLRLPSWKKFLVIFLCCFGSSFLGIDTTIAGNNFNHTAFTHNYSNGHDVKNGKKKGTHKKKRHKRIAMQKIPFDAFSTISGFTAPYWVERRTTPTIPELTDPGTFKNLTDTGTAIKNDISQGKPVKKQPLPGWPLQDSAFIVPTAFAARNPFSKKKKA
ncbi:hypothetical protein [Ferruginibacter sp.]